MNEQFLVAAFSGWGDASNVATTSAAFLLQKRDVSRALELDPEEHFVLTETRPWVRHSSDGERRIQWPALALMVGRGAPRDAAVLIGPEPHLRWRAFARTIAEYWAAHGANGPVILLGAFLAGVSHTSPVPLTGFATTPECRARMDDLGIQSSAYEGPTSVHSVLAEALHEAGAPVMSIWAAVPHYTGSMPNPKACVALLSAVDAVLGLGLDLTDLRDAAETYERQVSLALTRGGATLALGAGKGADTDAVTSSENEPLPPTDELVRGVEEFLRRNRPD